MKLPKKWIYILSGGAGILIVLAILLYVGVDSILENIAKVGITGFLIFLLNSLLVLVVGTFSWVIILGSISFRAPFLELVVAKVVGFAMSFLTPSMNLGGEPARTYYLHKKCRLPGSALFSTVIIDKFLELVGFFIFLFLGSLVAYFRYPLSPALDGLMLLGTSVLGVFLALSFLTFMWGFRPFSRILHLFSSRTRLGRAVLRKRKWVVTVEDLIHDSVVRKRSSMLAAVIFSTASIFFIFIKPAIFFYFLEGKMVFTVAELAVIFTLSQLLMTFQITPGSFGILEAGQVGIFAIVGITEPEKALAYTMMTRITDLLLVGFGIHLTVQFGLRQFLAEAREYTEEKKPQVQPKG